MNSIFVHAVSELIELFEQDLAEVTFPNVDRERLQALRAEVDEARADVEERRVALEAAKREQEEREAALIKAAVLAQRYARVYAGDDEALLERVDAIELAPKPAKKVRRPRKKKAVETMPLALSDEAEETPAENAA
ncbi:MAG: hypothetical protein AAGE52_35085 [Myxococcota bacterium]